MPIALAGVMAGAKVAERARCKHGCTLLLLCAPLLLLGAGAMPIVLAGVMTGAMAGAMVSATAGATAGAMVDEGLGGAMAGVIKLEGRVEARQKVERGSRVGVMERGNKMGVDKA